ncbi:MAG: SRPBCC family protein [Promethearchaeota archaeon]
MPKIERSIEINAPSNNVWKVLTDLTLIPKWNITVKEIKETEPQKGSVKSTVGDFTYKLTELVENKNLTAEVDHPDFNGYGYVLSEKGDITKLSYWEDFKIITHEKIQARALEILLKEIKKFAEYLEDGGEPDEYDRRQILVKP